MSTFGSSVSNFVHNFQPSEPIEPQGRAVSDFVHETHIPPNPVTPQGLLVSQFVHAIPPNPIEPQGLLVSSFVHELHEPSSFVPVTSDYWMP
jgi:hypothetical protein